MCAVCAQFSGVMYASVMPALKCMGHNDHAGWDKGGRGQLMYCPTNVQRDMGRNVSRSTAACMPNKNKLFVDDYSRMNT